MTIHKTRGVADIDKQFGVRIRAIRVQQGISQDSLAQAVGVSFQQIQKYEKGSNRVSLARAVQIATVLHTTVNELSGVDGKAIADTSFNHATFKLAQSLERLHALSPSLAADYRRSIDTVSDVLEAKGGKKKRKR
jgi:transcriptional regulator with XRE-family HTH domain